MISLNTQNLNVIQIARNLCDVPGDAEASVAAAYLIYTQALLNKAMKQNGLMAEGGKGLGTA